MNRKEFIEKDPLTNKILDLLRNNVKNSYTAVEMKEELYGDVFTVNQVQLVMDLLMKEGLIRVSIKDGGPAYQIRP